MPAVPWLNARGDLGRHSAKAEQAMTLCPNLASHMARSALSWPFGTPQEGLAALETCSGSTRVTHRRGGRGVNRLNQVDAGAYFCSDYGGEACGGQRRAIRSFPICLAPPLAAAALGGAWAAPAEARTR